MARITIPALCAISLVLASARAADFTQEPACQTLQPASSGGPMPKSPDLLVLRYFSYGNYEAGLSRQSPAAGCILRYGAFPAGGTQPVSRNRTFTRADAILIGHTHLDHFADAPAIAKRTGAPVFIAPPGVGYLKAHGFPTSRST